VPISKRTGKQYAAGSTRKWGGWEPRTCHTCGQRIPLRSNGAHHYLEGRVAVSFCSEHMGDYLAAHNATQHRREP
jgi:hypothetical protein